MEANGQVASLCLSLACLSTDAPSDVGTTERDDRLAGASSTHDQSTKSVSTHDKHSICSSNMTQNAAIKCSPHQLSSLLQDPHAALTVACKGRNLSQMFRNCRVSDPGYCTACNTDWLPQRHLLSGRERERQEKDRTEQVRETYSLHNSPHTDHRGLHRIQKSSMPARISKETASGNYVQCISWISTIHKLQWAFYETIE